MEGEITMHMADALVSPAVAGTMAACSVGAAAYSIRKIRLTEEPDKIPVMGVMGAFVFAAQMINFTIPGTGSSGHLCGGMLLTALLGPYAAFLTMIGVLVVQCLLFADGGILALGCNIWNMAFYGCFLGYFLFWKPMQKRGISRTRIMFASIAGAVISLQAGAFSVTLETLFSGVTSLPFGVFLAAMQPIHLVIGLVEGLITSAVLLFIYEARPSLLEGEVQTAENTKKTFSLRKTLLIMAAAAVFTGGALSLAASEYPDGLEWSIAKITGDTEVAPGEGKVYKDTEKIQNASSLFPDYSFRNLDTPLGTSFSGIAGSAVVLAVCVGGCYAIRVFRKKKE